MLLIDTDLPKSCFTCRFKKFDHEADMCYCKLDGTCAEYTSERPSHCPIVKELKDIQSNGDLMIELLKGREDCIHPSGKDKMTITVDTDWWMKLLKQNKADLERT